MIIIVIISYIKQIEKEGGITDERLQYDTGKYSCSGRAHVYDEAGMVGL